MRIFVTGATGFIGSAVVPELLGAGHHVVGLARSDAAARALAAVGVEVQHGALDDTDSLRAGVAKADGVIHLAFNHDFSRFAESARVEQRAIEALGAALEGSERPLTIASGVLGLAPGRVVTEEDQPNFDAPTSPRAAGMKTALSFAERGVRVSLVRLAPSVHGRGDHGFVARLVDIAREKGVSGHIADGVNRWPAVHRLDAARLFRLALEKAPAGSSLHAVADEGVPIRDIAAVIGRHLGLPVTSIAPEDAPDHFGWLAGPLALDAPASSAITRKLLDWTQSHPGLLDDLDEGHYFASDLAA
ncbi:SDR family oxidoreductase [Haliangium sp.]|uniref:SDR family oxidoreductase n=1 Tax=Haliangium sp. TaxID=2663208 RepID=UPI003D0E215C